jgi:hypothetical protein
MAVGGESGADVLQCHAGQAKLILTRLFATTSALEWLDLGVTVGISSTQTSLLSTNLSGSRNEAVIFFVVRAHHSVSVASDC